MNTYTELQLRLVTERQAALRREAQDARLLSSPASAASPAISGRAEQAASWPADGEPLAAAPRSLGAAAAQERTSGPRHRDTSECIDCGGTAAAA